jgi:hypothetical protein
MGRSNRISQPLGIESEITVEMRNLASTLQGVDDVLHEQYEVQIVGRGAFELRNQVQIEVTSKRRLRVNQQATTTDSRTQLSGPPDDISYESSA